MQGKLNADIVGKPAAWIAEQAGFKVPEGTNILAAECAEVGPNEPLLVKNFLQSLQY